MIKKIIVLLFFVIGLAFNLEANMQVQSLIQAKQREMIRHEGLLEKNKQLIKERDKLKKRRNFWAVSTAVMGAGAITMLTLAKQMKDLEKELALKRDILVMQLKNNNSAEMRRQLVIINNAIVDITNNTTNVNNNTIKITQNKNNISNNKIVMLSNVEDLAYLCSDLCVAGANPRILPNSSLFCIKCGYL